MGSPHMLFVHCIIVVLIVFFIPAKSNSFIYPHSTQVKRGDFMILKGRTALITGATGGGMGRSCALTLAKNGCDIILNYGTNRQDTAADKKAYTVKEKIEAMGQNVLLAKADTKNSTEVSLMVQKAVEKFKKIDILVNNAGAPWYPKEITEIPPEQVRLVLQAEIDGVFNCIRECLPIMRENKWGRIITIGAYKAGVWAAEDFGPIEYAIGKAGRALLTDHLALKERKYNITVNMVNPGPGHTAHIDIDTALQYVNHSKPWINRQKSTPQDIAEAVLFLCTEKARFITGTHIAFSTE
jgi:3-oxoacyl-[acyl-carrier protein] reductase